MATFGLQKHGFWNFIPATATNVARATSCQAGLLSPWRHVLVKQVKRPVILARQEMLCLAGMTVADQNLQVAPLLFFFHWFMS